ncbi:MAG: L,D-transpeptidase family protein [Deltaproteobacteria bacterium]|nr:L,D-transpeptidase family protein [Deltaproteobacteria bacterium]
MSLLRALAIPLALAVLPVDVAFAAEGAPPAAARALAPAADLIIDSGLARLGPAIVRRAMTPDTSADGATRALAAALSGGAVEALIVGAYGATPTFVHTTDAGLSPAGEVALAWIDRARHHGVELVVDEAARAFAAGRAPPPEPPEVSLDDLRAAWGGSMRPTADGASGDERLARAALVLRQRVPALAPAPSGGSDADAARRVAAELALSRGLARLVAELPSRPRTTPVLAHADEGYYLSPDTVWRGAPAPEATVEALTAALTAAREGRLDAHLGALEPGHPQYPKLVAAAERYAAICAEGEWEVIALPKNDKEALAPEAMQALARRLAREGFGDGTVGEVPPEPEGKKPRGKAQAVTFPPALEQAVTAYRERRQLKRKSLVDRDLVASLAVPCGERLRTLELNVRRWRHSGWTPTPHWVQVNLAAQEMRFYRDGQLEMKQRTVVGSNASFVNQRLQRRIYRNSSPVLMDHISQVIINPEWNVPPRIAREELEPEIEKDPDYMTKKGFRVVTAGNGSKYYVQAPGPGNALGQIKILFPNSESVYLHDTPGKNAFKLPQRALSHGCVRVDNAMDFGIAILRHDAEDAGRTFDEQWVRARTYSPRSTPITLTSPIPVFLEYYTASVDEDGHVWFHPDIYGYDAETFGTVAGP